MIYKFVNKINNIDKLWMIILEEVRTLVKIELRQADFCIEYGFHKDKNILNVAMAEKSYEFVESLLKNGAVPTETTMLIAIKEGSYYIVKEILQHSSGQVTEEILYVCTIGTAS